MTSGRQRVAWILLGLLLVWPGWVWGQRVAADPIRFPTSGTPDAQRSFLAGVKLLHNFEYDDAINTFRDAIKTQPNFAMAYWGLAMSYNHPLWGEQDLDTARPALADLAKISVSGLTPREQGFLDAVKKLYGPGDKLARDKAYAEAMHRLHMQFPDDDEAASFYGLALLGLRADTSDFLYTIEASDVLEKVYAHNPNHPGVLHYLVHCYDDPRYASLGLQAADRYEQVAADSAHALHMPAHIYLDLGMWKAFVHANEASWAASLDRLRREHLTPGQHDIHALHTLLWLEYGYLQQGEFAKAMDCLKTMARIEALSSSPMVEWYAAMMRAAYIVDAPDAHEMMRAPELKAINTLDLHKIELTAPASDAFADGLIADRQRQPQEALQAREKIDAYIQHAQHLIQGHGGHQHSSFFSSTYASSIAPAHIMESQRPGRARSVATGRSRRRQAAGRLRPTGPGKALGGTTGRGLSTRRRSAKRHAAVPACIAALSKSRGIPGGTAGSRPSLRRRSYRGESDADAASHSRRWRSSLPGMGSVALRKLRATNRAVIGCVRDGIVCGNRFLPLPHAAISSHRRSRPCLHSPQRSHPCRHR